MHIFFNKPQTTQKLKEFTFPCEVAAGRWNKLRESGHGWPASFRRCRDASFGSDSNLSI